MTDYTKIVELLKNTISEERLESYKLNPDDSDEEIVGNYIFNIKISESLYPMLSALEVTLRNNIHKAVAAIYGNNWLLKDIIEKKILVGTEAELLQEAYKRLGDKRKQNPINEGGLVAELTFGFWVNLCKKMYKNSIWDKPDVFNCVFPDFAENYICTELDKTKTIFPELKMVLNLRNRVFHHEIIINNPEGIENIYKRLEKILYSLSADYAKIFENSFRFNDVIKQKLR